MEQNEKVDTREWIPFSEILERELRDPEFRRLWEELQEKKSKRKAKAKRIANSNMNSFSSESTGSKFATN